MNFGVLSVKMAEEGMGEGGNENRIRPSDSALSVSCLRTGVRRKNALSAEVCVTVLLIHLPQCPDLGSGQQWTNEGKRRG